MVRLAKARFGSELTPGELALIYNVAQNKTTRLSSEGDLPPANPQAHHLVKAQTIRWLFSQQLNESTGRPFPGISVTGAFVDGHLDLSDTNFRFPLRLENSRFAGEIRIQRSSMALISFNGSVTRTVRAQGLKVSHGFFLRGGITEGAIYLGGAEIGGNLDLKGRQIAGNGRDALIADMIDVDGSVYLGNGFEAVETVRFLGAAIGQNLDCNNGRFSQVGRAALNLDRLRTDGGVLLGRGFTSQGEVRLLGAQLGQGLNCGGGRFLNPGRTALEATGTDIGGGVFLDDGFRAEGTVKLARARIGRNVICDGGQFYNPDGIAIAGGGIEIRGDLTFREGFVTSGHIDLEGAKIDGLLYWLDRQRPHELTHVDLRSASAGALSDDLVSWPRNVRLDGFQYGRLYSAPDVTVQRRVKEWIRSVDTGSHFRPQPYEQLSGVLEAAGYGQEARQVRIMREEDPRRVRALGAFEVVWHWVFRISIKYGYRPMRAISWILGLVAIGSLVFWWAEQQHYLARSTRGYCPRFSAIVYSLDSFVPLIDLHQAKYRHPGRRGLRIYFWVHTLLGWLFSTVIVVALTRLVR